MKKKLFITKKDMKYLKEYLSALDDYHSLMGDHLSVLSVWINRIEKENKKRLFRVLKITEFED